SKARLTVLRDGKSVELTVAVNELDGASAAGLTGGDAPNRSGDSAAPESKSNALGIVAQDVDPAARQRLGLMERGNALLAMAGPRLPNPKCVRLRELEQS
ncbi:hypothetical protein AB4084_35910, partial [Lysobacter sp. 2RAB21]